MVVAAALAAAVGGAAEGPVRVTVTVTPQDVTVGQTFTVELATSAPPGTGITFPEGVADETIELAPQAGTGTPLPPGVARYQGRCFTLAEAAVPPLTLRYRLPDGREGETTTSPVPLRIVSILPKGEEAPALADIRPPVQVPVTAIFVAAVAVLVAALAALLFALLRRRRAQATVPAAPKVPPDAEALAALDRLAAAGLVERQEYKAFYVALMAIAKRYLERRFEAPILEMTTTEMVAFLRRHPLGSELLGTVRELAQAADHVKFARGDAQRALAERHLAQARELVATLEGRLAETRNGQASELRRTA